MAAMQPPPFSGRQSGHSFDDLVGAGEDRRRDREAACICSLEIDHQLEFCRLLDRQIGRLGAVENFSDVDADLAMDRRKAGAIADQTASLGVYAPRINRRNRLTYGQSYQLLAMAFEKGISLDDQPVGAQLPVIIIDRRSRTGWKAPPVRCNCRGSGCRGRHRR